LAHAQARPASGERAAPLAFGETFTINSKVLRETRRINVCVPPGYQEAAETRLPVLYMPDDELIRLPPDAATFRPLHQPRDRRRGPFGRREDLDEEGYPPLRRSGLFLLELPTRGLHYDVTYTDLAQVRVGQ